jgi:hypothetical protein
MSMKTYRAAQCDKCGNDDETLWNSTEESNSYLLNNGWSVNGDEHICSDCLQKPCDTHLEN